MRFGRGLNAAQKYPLGQLPRRVPKPFPWPSAFQRLPSPQKISYPLRTLPVQNQKARFLFFKSQGIHAGKPGSASICMNRTTGYPLRPPASATKSSCELRALASAQPGRATAEDFGPSFLCFALKTVLA